MATPHVAGAAALLLARNPSLTVAELKTALLNTVDTSPTSRSAQRRLQLFDALDSVADGAPPEGFFTQRPPARTNNFATSGLQSNEPGGVHVRVLAHGAPFAPCASPHVELGPFAEGSHTFAVSSHRRRKTEDPTPAVATWIIDLTRPNTTITARPPANTRSRTATFRFTSNEPGSKFQCRHMSGPGSPAPPRRPTGLGRLPTFRVRAIDAAGNMDPTAAVDTWRVLR